MIDLSTPMGTTPLDAPGGMLGQPLDRIDGPLKVTGRAPYAYEFQPPSAPAYGFLAVSTVGGGTLTGLDTGAAKRAPGVLLVLTHENMPPQAAASKATAPQLAGTKIEYMGQPIALVVAETFEQARAASYLIRATYDRTAANHDLKANRDKAFKPGPRNGTPADTNKGDVEAALGTAAATIDVTYSTPVQSHAMMEPHATLALWDGDRLTLFTANQRVTLGAHVVAATLQLPAEKVRVVSRFIGGGFGGKLDAKADAILAGAAARMLRRPIKLALTRPQIFPVTTNRSATIQRVRFGATADGTLQAVAHESWSANTPGDDNFENAAQATRNIYKTPNLMTAHRLVALDLPNSSAMRAPGEAVGLLALECAMDEMAERLGMDPIAFRIANEPTVDPQRGTPFSTRNMVPCLRKGAAMFGWDKRNATPGQVRDGEWLVGIGMSAAIRGNPMQKAKAHVALDKDGVLLVQSSMTDIGTGSYTILAQIAAELLGLPIEQVRMQLGDSDLPETPGSGGSFGANSAGSAVYDACMNLRAELARRAGIEQPAFADGAVAGNGKSVRLAALSADGPVAADGAADPGDSRRAFTQQSFGAHFAEVAVNGVTGEVRLRRMLGVFSAGRLLNAKTARSQAIGGMAFGVGAALMEEVMVDTRDGDFVNRNLAEYHILTHADAPNIDAVFIEEPDLHSSAMKSKGLGELGICGAGAAVANAVYNASGVRIRDFPLTLDKVLDGWDRAGRQQRSDARP